MTLINCLKFFLCYTKFSKDNLESTIVMWCSVPFKLHLAQAL